MTPRPSDIGFRWILVYVLVQCLWLFGYSFIPGGPHFVQIEGLAQQVFANLFSIFALYFLVTQSFLFSLIAILVTRKALQKTQRVISFGKIKVVLSMKSVWTVVVSFCILLEFLQHVWVQHDNGFRAIIFGFLTFAANYSAFWLASKVGSRKVF